jgi:cell division initiation protein
MEISAKVLREVEFSGSLRGYNTDEVDEFLEQVAIGVDSMQGEAQAAIERAEQAARTPMDRTGLEDEESIRRTLVLAQRTADLAIKEAQEEAAQILDRSRAEAETLVHDARESAERMTSEAERRLRDEVARLSHVRDELKSEADTLISLLSAERERLTESLSTALRYVERSLTPSADITSLPGSEPRDGLERAAAEAVDDDGEDTGQGYAVMADAPDSNRIDEDEVDDLEAAIAEDAAAAAPSRMTAEERGLYSDGALSASMEYERPNLTALPSLDDSAHDTAAWPVASAGQADWPA